MARLTPSRPTTDAALQQQLAAWSAAAAPHRSTAPPTSTPKTPVDSVYLQPPRALLAVAAALSPPLSPAARTDYITLQLSRLSPIAHCKDSSPASPESLLQQFAPSFR